MKYWKYYVTTVSRNCTNPGNNEKDVAYWRDNLFAGLIIYFLPFCFIALLPGLFYSFLTGRYILGAMDVLSAAAFAVVAFKRGIPPGVRRTIFLFFSYLLSCVLLYYLGLAGPGLLYLLSTCLFCILIFPTRYTFWPAWLNAFICFLYGLAIVRHLVPFPAHQEYKVDSWVAVSSNLVFLSFLLAALIPRLFNGLQETIDKEKILKEELGIQQQSLTKALSMLQRKNNELEQFAYVASHDLKEPIRMVTSFMGLLKNKYNEQLDEKAHTYIDFAIDGGKRMQKMISDLLEFSRTASQEKETVNLDDIWQEVRQNIFRLVEESRAEIILNTELPTLSIRRQDFTRLLQNLLINAIKFRKKEISPVVSMSLVEKEQEWLFSIEDNGIGIEKEKFNKIFEIFVRIHAQEMIEGTGIGLAICKKIVEQHGGTIWVESEEGKGSTFHFTILKHHKEQT